MKKTLARLFAAALALAMLIAASGCSFLVPLTGEYRILSINSMGPKRFLESDEAEMLLAQLGAQEDFVYDGPANELMTVALEEGGTAFVTKLGFGVYGTWDKSDSAVTVFLESGEMMVFEHFEGSSGLTLVSGGFTIVFSRM